MTAQSEAVPDRDELSSAERAWKCQLVYKQSYEDPRFALPTTNLGKYIFVKGIHIGRALEKNSTIQF